MAVEQGDPLATVHARTGETAEAIGRRVLDAITIGPGPADPLPLIVRRMDGSPGE
jgi:hypothetical protein